MFINSWESCLYYHQQEYLPPRYLSELLTWTTGIQKVLLPQQLFYRYYLPLLKKSFVLILFHITSAYNKPVIWIRRSKDNWFSWWCCKMHCDPRNSESRAVLQKQPLAPPGTPPSAAQRQATKQATEQRKMLGNFLHPKKKHENSQNNTSQVY